MAPALLHRAATTNFWIRQLQCVAVRTGRCGFEDVNLLEVVGESVDDVAVFVTELDLREDGDTLLLDGHSGRLHAHTHTHAHTV